MPYRTGHLLPLYIIQNSMFAMFLCWMIVQLLYIFLDVHSKPKTQTDWYTWTAVWVSAIAIYFCLHWLYSATMYLSDLLFSTITVFHFPYWIVFSFIWALHQNDLNAMMFGVSYYLNTHLIHDELAVEWHLFMNFLIWGLTNFYSHKMNNLDSKLKSVRVRKMNLRID